MICNACGQETCETCGDCGMPRCERCPVCSVCAGRRSGDQPLAFIVPSYSRKPGDVVKANDQGVQLRRTSAWWPAQRRFCLGSSSETGARRPAGRLTRLFDAADGAAWWERMDKASAVGFGLGLMLGLLAAVLLAVWLRL